MSDRPAVPSCLTGWLAAVVPAAARQFKVSDEELAGTLRDAGAEITCGGADVEIATPDDVEGLADRVVVVVGPRDETDESHMRRSTRLWLTAQVRSRAARCGRALKRRGYSQPDVVMWDCEAPIYLPGVRDRRGGKRLSHLLPRRALVIASRRPQGPTLLEAIADDAAKAGGGPVRYGWPLSSEGLTIAVAENCVLRIAVGAGRRRIDDQRDALEALTAVDPPSILRSRVPWLLGGGRVGVADWSAERRLPGTTPSKLSSPVIAECCGFLAELFDISEDRVARTSPAADADTIAALCRNHEAADSLRSLGREVEAALSAVPRGFGHGDFWWRNLLVRDGSLSGVIEWDAAGPGRLPLLDLLHLRLGAERQRKWQYLGVAVVDYFVPWARAGGDELVRSFARRIGMEVFPELLETLTIAYWLDRVASDLTTFANRRHRPVWLRPNVDYPAEWLLRNPPRLAV